MIEFKTRIEAGTFYFEVVADIFPEEENDVIIHTVYFDGCSTPLNPHQMEHFIRSYGEADLVAEILTQCRRDHALLVADMAGLEWETVQIKEAV